MNTRRILAVLILSIVLWPMLLAAQPSESKKQKPNTATGMTERDAQTRRYNECTKRCDDRVDSCQRNRSQGCSQEYSSCSRECEKIIH
jgi:hypothetical protein